MNLPLFQVSLCISAPFVDPEGCHPECASGARSHVMDCKGNYSVHKDIELIPAWSIVRLKTCGWASHCYGRVHALEG